MCKAEGEMLNLVRNLQHSSSTNLQNQEGGGGTKMWCAWCGEDTVALTQGGEKVSEYRDYPLRKPMGRKEGEGGLTLLNHCQKQHLQRILCKPNIIKIAIIYRTILTYHQ